MNGISITKAWNELKRIDNEISLLETLRAIKGTSIKANQLKEILVSGGGVNNNAIYNSIMDKDEYTADLKKLYLERNAYETYILNELDRIKISEPSIAIAFLREEQKLRWKDVSKIMNYSEKQCRRYYDKYLISIGKTPKNNSFLEDDHK